MKGFAAMNDSHLPRGMQELSLYLLEKVLASLQDFYGHPHGQLILVSLYIVKQRSALHAQTTCFGRSLVDLSVRSQGLVRLDRMSYPGIWIDIG